MLELLRQLIESFLTNSEIIITKKVDDTFGGLIIKHPDLGTFDLTPNSDPEPETPKEATLEPAGGPVTDPVQQEQRGPVQKKHGEGFRHNVR